ncbi:MAG: type IV secretion system protein [Synergistaceae bacterium]|jgi:type IV secretion system protein VirB5|nr:type IV secretion system protein [Synergistaceae bacterium]
MVSLFKRGKKTDQGAEKTRDGTQSAESAGVKQPEFISMPAAEKTAQDAFVNNPWLKSKKRHADIYEGLASAVSQWRLATLTMMILLTFSVAGNIILAMSVKIQPYVIQVDKQGYAVPVKMVDASNVDQRVIFSQIGLFIFNSRTRLLDREAQLIFSEHAYRSIAEGSSAARRLNDYFSKNPPTRAPFPVMVQIESIIPFTTHTYQARWTEVTETENQSVKENSYVGLFTVSISPPADFTNLMSNPLGVYITDYDIEQNLIIE